MKCIYCQKNHDWSTIGGLIYFYCCEKTHIIKQSVRPRVLQVFRDSGDVVLIDSYDEFITFILRTNVL